MNLSFSRGRVFAIKCKFGGFRYFAASSLHAKALGSEEQTGVKRQAKAAVIVP